jgi:Peptidoglycan-synthase activator LpoB
MVAIRTNKPLGSDLYRQFALLVGASMCFAGCQNHRYAHVLDESQRDMVGSHQAGAETFDVLVGESVAKLLDRQIAANDYPLTGQPGQKRICFAGIENRSSEDIGDFKDQLFEQIDSAVSSSGVFQTISPRFVESGLRQLRIYPADLMVPSHRAAFLSVMEQQDQPFDYLLFARLTSGTTQHNTSYQRDYVLTLELVDLATGSHDKESAELRKGYHKSRISKWTGYGLMR